MAIRNIIKDGDPRLRKVAREVTDFGDRTQMIVDDLIDTLYENGNGIGLAANQIGILRRIFVVDLQDEDGLRVFINPEITNLEGEQIGQEGCLSIPEFWGYVERPEKIKVRAQDRNGETFELEAEDLLAVCICHENDHLNGVLFKDRVIPEDELPEEYRDDES